MSNHGNFKFQTASYSFRNVSINKAKHFHSIAIILRFCNYHSQVGHKIKTCSLSSLYGRADVCTIRTLIKNPTRSPNNRWSYFFHFFSGCSMHLSSAINPFLYSLLSKRFRRGFHDLKRRYIYPLLGKRVVTVPVSNPNNLSFRGHPRLLRMRGAALRHFRRHSWGDMVNTGEAAVDKVDGGATSGHEMRRLRDYTRKQSV